MSQILFALVDAMNSKEVHNCLAEDDADANAVDENGISSLMRSAWQGDVETMKVLLEHGAKADAQDNFNYSAMMHAGQYGQEEALEILLKVKANTRLVNKNGDTAATLAFFAGHGRFAKRISEYETLELPTSSAVPAIIFAED